MGDFTADGASTPDGTGICNKSTKASSTQGLENKQKPSELCSYQTRTKKETKPRDFVPRTPVFAWAAASTLVIKAILVERHIVAIPKRQAPPNTEGDQRLLRKARLAAEIPVVVEGAQSAQEINT